MYHLNSRYLSTLAIKIRYRQNLCAYKLNIDLIALSTLSNKIINGIQNYKPSEF